MRSRRPVHWLNRERPLRPARPVLRWATGTFSASALVLGGLLAAVGAPDQANQALVAPTSAFAHPMSAPTGPLRTATSATSTPSPSSPAAPTDEPAAPTEPQLPVPGDQSGTGLRVDIDTLRPGTLPVSGALTVRGKVTNSDSQPWSELSAYLIVSPTPFTTPEELAQAAVSDPLIEIGPRIVEPGSFASLPDLAPGESARFKIRVPAQQLATSAEQGVYWLAVHVLGSDEAGRDTVADGRGRTFLPYVSQPKGKGRDRGARDKAATTLALSVPFRARTDRAADFTFEPDGAWHKTLEPSGRLSRLLSWARSATDFEMDWIVDPAVYVAADDMAAGNKPKTLLSVPAQDQPQVDPDTLARPPTAQLSGPQLWVDEFLAGARATQVLTLPFGDLDLNNATSTQPVGGPAAQLISEAYRQSALLWTSLELDVTELAAPLWENLSAASLQALPPQTDALIPLSLPERTFRRSVLIGDPSEANDAGALSPVQARDVGGAVAFTFDKASVAGPTPGRTLRALPVRQRILAEAAVHALSDNATEPLIITLPNQWNPGAGWRRADFFDALAISWLDNVSLSQLLDNSNPPIGSTSDLPGLGNAEATDNGLGNPAAIDAAVRLVEASSTVAEVFGDSTETDQLLNRTALTVGSVWNRRTPRAAAQRADQVLDATTTLLDPITVEAPSFVTFSSEQGTFPVTLVNGLKRPVTVGLSSSVVGGGVKLSDVGAIDLPPRGRKTVQVTTLRAGIGINQVTLQPVTASGTVIGTPATMSIRSSQVGLVIWAIIIGASVLLFGAITVRLTRRFLRHRRVKR